MLNMRVFCLRDDQITHGDSFSFTTFYFLPAKTTLSTLLSLSR